MACMGCLMSIHIRRKYDEEEEKLIKFVNFN